MTNARTGPSRGTAGRPGALPWDEDGHILERMQEGAKLRSQGLTSPEIAVQLGISRTQVYEDRNRLLALRKEQAVEAVDEHIENLRQQQREIIKALQGTDRRSLNVGQLRGLLRQIEMDVAKLDGSLVERKETKLDAEGLTFTLNLKPAE